MANKTFNKRQVVRKNCICRYCDELIPQGEYMVAGYSHRNRGIHMYFHLECAKEIGRLADGET